MCLRRKEAGQARRKEGGANLAALTNAKIHALLCHAVSKNSQKDVNGNSHK